ncbi:MAG: molybdopterin-dependent oxidoreductase [Oscillospiraceae bacterium]|nr:molybdopterin-dependent oxidoreductase [Oscillospiraceae bacterium]
MADLAGANGLRENFRVVGTRNLPGRLSYALATGIAKFGIDYVLPDMLHAKFLRSPYANAKVLSVDASKAWAIPGVVDIVTWEDEDVKELGTHGETFGPPKPMLDNVADREGAEVAIIVVAEDEDICEEALRALEIEWEVYPHVTDLLDGRREDAPIIRPGENNPPSFGRRRVDDDTPPKKGNVYFANMASGDIEKGFDEADHIAEFSLYTPAMAAHLPNPSGSVAWWSRDPYQGEGDNLHIEGAVREKYAISATYGVPDDKTIQEGLFMGGKYCDWGLRKSQEITPLLAKRTGRPVRCINTREETYDFLMNARHVYMKVGFKNDGSITAVDDHSIADNGSRGSSAFGNVGDLTQGPYNTLRCQNVFQHMEIVDSNRGVMYVSGQHCPFNWDSITMALYLIAEKLDMDPLEVARLNLHGPTSQDDTNPVPSFDMCVEAGKELMNWDWHKAGMKKLPDGRMHGMSFRYQMCPRHSGMQYKCKLEFRDGVVHMPTQGPLFGAYVVECNAMVVAEELGLNYEDVSIDYDYREPFRAFGGGSDGTTASAWAMKECANKLRQQILEAAIDYANNPPPPGFMGPPGPKPGPFAGMSPDDLDIFEGKVIIKGQPDQGVPLAQATQQNLFATFTGRPPLSVWSAGEMGKQLDVMNTAFCEVAVDTETGEVEILRFGVAADPGLVLRPISLESQIDQVMFFSQGCQLLEDFVFDGRTGVLLNNNMIDYKKPGILDAAQVDQKFVESRGSNAAYGASGISHSLANTHLVIIAIHNAIGAWVDPPATPDKVLRALGKI